MENSLEREFQTFEARKSELVKDHAGKFVLIKNDDIIGIFDDELEAIKQGADRFGQVPFLVNEITDANFEIHFVPRLVRV